jgi:hypothetical protein
MRHVSIDEEEDPEAREVHINRACHARSALSCVRDPNSVFSFLGGNIAKSK